MRTALKEVVSKRGTALSAAIPGISAGGKTGTAQMARPRAEGGGYYSDRFLTSFIGFFPVDEPQIVCIVMVSHPKVPESVAYGGKIAAPVFSKIGEQAARYLNLPPEGTHPVAQHR